MNRSNNIDSYLLLVVLVVVFAVVVLLLPLESRSEVFLIACAASITWGVARRSKGVARTVVVGALLFMGAAYVFQRPEPLLDLFDFGAVSQTLGFDLHFWFNSLLSLPFLLLGMLIITRALSGAPAPAPASTVRRQRPRSTLRLLVQTPGALWRGFRRLPWPALLELFLIALVAWKATESLHDFSRQVQLGGVDMVPLTRAADFAGQFLRGSGRIPLWDPFIGNGEPMLESVQSFILNPLMSGPIMLLGAKPGVLVVTLLHAVLLGWGGWAWAKVMGLGAAGRLLMGALLVSSGSFTGPISHGVFQLAMSQAYVPYVYAGLIAMLFIPRQRWGLLLFVTATALVIFSGSFWYLLPTAFGCGLIALLALVRFKGRSPRLDLSRLGRLVLAGVFVVGVGAVRLLTVRRDLLLHPSLSYNFQLDFLQVLVNYFDPNYTTDRGQWFTVYHYVVPALFALVVVVLGLLTLRWLRPRFTGGWRVVAAGVVIVLVMSVFGTGPTPTVMSIYDALPILADWRNPGRMAAAASPWIVLAVAWCFDRLVRLAWAWYRRPPQWKYVGAASVGALVVAAAFSVINIANNWPPSAILQPTQGMYSNQVEAARILRGLYPSQMLAIHTGWLEHFTLNEMLIRHPYGDNEVFTIGLPPTIGGEQFEYREEFAFGDAPDSGNGIWLLENGYAEMPNVPVDGYIGALLDYNPQALPYAYVVPEQTLLEQGDQLLTRSQVMDTSYFHRIDQVEVDVTGAPPGSVVVAQETAYPGWVVSVNGLDQPIQSVHHRIAVRLPPDVRSATVVFTYRPDALYDGGLITVISIALLAGYGLRAERRLLRRERGAGDVLPLPVTERIPAAVPAPLEPEPIAERIPATQPLGLDAPETLPDAVETPRLSETPARRSTVGVLGAVLGVIGIAVVSVVVMRWRGSRRGP